MNQVFVVFYEHIPSWLLLFLLLLKMYVNWEKKQHLIYSSKWYSFNTIVDYLHDLKLTIILNTFNKERSNTLILSVVPPVSKEKRFSKGEGYLCEGIGDWKLKLNTINSLFQQMDGYVETQIISLINQLFGSIEHDIINMQRFEAHFNMVWRDEFSHNLNDCDNLFCILFKRVLWLKERVFDKLKTTLPFYTIKWWF